MTELSEFHDVRFPLAVAFGATGGPERRNEIVSLTSGREKRNQRFAHSRRRYDAGTGVRSLADLHEVMAFFEARRGSLHAFRFRDPFDMRSCPPDRAPGWLDQPLGSGDGTNARFALLKTYGTGADAYRRPIRKPVEDAILVAIDGVEKASPAFSFDQATGDIVFAAEEIPAPGQLVTAGYEFDVPVRFDTDSLSASLTAFKAGQFPAIPLIEVLL
ncbi:MAG: DUF2460 domain-containing protein [Rhizobiaceae bacterium]|nr:DUF2460 domain-containing protein [Rhizobiaceae bacterium]